MQTCVFYIDSLLDWISVSVSYRNSTQVCLNMKSQILNICNEEFPICEIQNQFLKKMVKVPYTSAHYPKSNKDQKRLCA